MDMAALFGSVSAGLSGQFGGPYHAGQVVDQIAPVYDDGGSIVTPGTVQLRDCLIQIDSATEAMRQSEGFADGDMRCLILSSSLAGALGTDAQIKVTAGPYAGSTWMVSSIERDAFASYWAGKGRRGG